MVRTKLIDISVGYNYVKRYILPNYRPRNQEHDK